METATTSRDRSRTTVTNGWNVSVTDPHQKAYVELNIFRVDHEAPNQWGGKGVVINHPEDGRRFSKKDGAVEAIEAAWDWAFGHGFLVYYEGSDR